MVKHPLVLICFYMRIEAEPNMLSQHFMGYFPHKRFLLATGRYCTGNFLEIFSQIDPDKIIACFPVEICLWTRGQHWAGDFLV